VTTRRSGTSWVADQARRHPGHVVLLATRMPQELAVGLGVQAGQRALAGGDPAEPRQPWPARLYPVHYVPGKHPDDSLVVPNLRLGADAVPAQRV